MKDLETEKKVIEIVNKISGCKISGFNYNGFIKDELSLDSIQIVELFACLEKEFDIELPLQMMTVKTCREFMDLLVIQLNNKLCHA